MGIDVWHLQSVEIRLAMYTNCPSCARQFHIYSQQLSAAKGMVQCGFCGKQFNALERLHDVPQAEGIYGQKDVKESKIEQEPQFFIPDVTSETGLQAADKEQGHRLQQTEVEVSDHADAHTQNQLAIDMELLETVRSKSGRMSSMMWSLGIIVTMVVLTAQAGWFNRDYILSKNPQFMPYATQLCERLQCNLIRNTSLSSIVLVNRDVRDHPRYEDALLVNATMENESDRIQPYPQVLLTLFDSQGALISYRQFSPKEYLDQSINIEEGRMPDKPLHFVFELTMSIEEAVSFEIQFI